MRTLFLWITVAVVSAVALFGVFSATRVEDTASADTERVKVWYENEAITDIASRVWSDSQSYVPTDKTYCYAYGLGDQTLDATGSASLSSLTGFTATDPIGDTQRGIYDGWLGSTSCQMDGTTMGFQLDKESIELGDSTEAHGSIYGMHMIRNWGSNIERQPWSEAYGLNPVLQIEANYAVQKWEGTGDTIQYGQFIVSLVDTTQSNDEYSTAIWLTVSLWDSRGTHDESIHVDYGGTINYIIDTYASDGLDFVTLSDESQNFAGDAECGCTWYSVDITEQNLVNAITAVNSETETDGGPADLYSLDPDDYAVNLIGGGTEMFSPDGSTGSVGSWMSDLTMLTEY